MLVNISGCRVQRLLNNLGLWEPATIHTHTSIVQHFWHPSALCNIHIQNVKHVSFNLLGPFGVVGNGLVDQVTGDLYDMNALMMHLWTQTHTMCAESRIRRGSRPSRCENINPRTASLWHDTIAVSSRAMSNVPVTSRKMIKILISLSKERSNHTIICKEKKERKREKWI